MFNYLGMADWYGLGFFISFSILGIFIGRVCRPFDEIDHTLVYIDKGDFYDKEIDIIKRHCGSISPEAVLICDYLKSATIAHINFPSGRPIDVFKLRQELIDSIKALRKDKG